MPNNQITPVRWVLLIVILIFLGTVTGGLLRQMSSSPVQAPVQAGAMPDFTLPDLKGQSVRLSEFLGGRPAVLSFGTTTCPYCNLQVQAFKELRSRFGDQLAILEINVGDSPERVAAHVAQLGSPFTTLMDRSGSVYSHYGDGGVPVTLILDGKRKILEKGGYIPAARIAQVLGLSMSTAQAG